MPTVVVHPARCVGCMQCMLACAVAHAGSQSLFAAVCETPLPKSRIHLGAGWIGQGFPNRCRHCNPAPCLTACLPGAIFRDADTQSVLINADMCINCASCAMACPFGVIRYHGMAGAPTGKTVAVKCDNCLARQRQGQIPACVAGCKTGALTFETLDQAMQRQTTAVARSMATEAEQLAPPPGLALLHAAKRAAYFTRKGGIHG